MFVLRRWGFSGLELLDFRCVRFRMPLVSGLWALVVCG